jgi:hypothetical protein
MTAPTTEFDPVPTKVTDVGLKPGGGTVQELDSVVRCGGRWIGALLFVDGATLFDAAGLWLGCMDAGVGPAATGRPAWLLAPTSCGTETAAASTTAQPAAATTACRALRCRARRRIPSSAPGGGLSGSTSPPSQSSISSRGLLTGLSQRGLQAGPGVEQVSLDGAFRAAEHDSHLLEPEASVVMQQEGTSQPFG